MKTKYLKITGKSENDSKVIEKAAEIIKKGGLVAIPTETVYGLAGSALIAESAEKIYAAKGRPSDNPLIVHIAKPDDAEMIAYTTELYFKLAEHFMPGPITVILKKKPLIPDSVTAGLDSVAIRCPSNKVAHELIRVSGHPIAAPSANRSGIPSPTRAEHVLFDMDGRIDMIIDGGECDIGLESTVVKADGDGIMILRPGAVTKEMLETVSNNVTVAKAVTDPKIAEKTAPESPGMKYKHYSPKADVLLLDGSDSDFISYVNSHAESGCGVLCTDEEAEAIQGVAILSVGHRGDAAEESKRFFNLLREADEMGLSKVYAKLPPKDGMYLAIYNRIIRAAGCRIEKI